MDKKSQLARILIVENSLGITGALDSILSSTRALSGKFQFHFLINAKSPCRDLFEQKGIIVHQLRFIEISKSLKVIFYLPRLILNTFHLLKIIHKENINLVHVNDMYNMLGVMIKIMNPRIKVVYHSRLLPNAYAGKLFIYWRALIERYADGIICVSEAVARNFKSPVVVIYDAIEAPKLRERSFNGTEMRLLYLANYTGGKGHEHAIEAFEQAREQIPILKMQMFGSTFGLRKNQSYKDGLLKKVQQIEFNDSIAINEFVDDKTKAFAHSDIFLNFSNSESFSMTTLEALAYGTPTIVTDCGGPAEIIEDGISGKLVPVGDVPAMAEAIVELAKDAQRRESFSINGRKRFEEKFNLEEQAKKLAEIYNSLLSTATSPRRHEAQEPAS